MTDVFHYNESKSTSSSNNNNHNAKNIKQFTILLILLFVSLFCLWILQEPLMNKHFQFIWIEESRENLAQFSKSSNSITIDNLLFDSWTNETKWNFTISYFDQHFQADGKYCDEIVQIGKDPPFQGDQDAYRICLDQRLAIKQGSCLVYSFGIANDWTFDDFMARKKSCDVFSFDPSMNLKNGSRRWAKMLFYQIGISSVDRNQSPPENDSFVENAYENKNLLWELRKLSSIWKQFKHENRTIDVLKIDVEGSEVLALEQALNESFLQNNVKQLVIEWHLWNSSIKYDHAALRKIFDVYNRLFLNGYQLFFKGKNDKRALKVGVFPFTCLVNTKFLNF